MIFTFKGCRLELRFSCFALLAFFCLFAGYTGGAAFLCAVLLHEAAHLGALFLFRAPPKAVSLSALGCRIVPDPAKPLSYRRNALVSLAGPAVNLLSFAGAACLGAQSSPFAAISLGLGVLHALPILPLDGGLALRALLSVRLAESAAEKISFLVSLFLLFPLAVLGFFVLLRTRRNFTLLALSVYLMLYLLLKQSSPGE